MTKKEIRILLNLLEEEWLMLQTFDLNQSPPLLQAAAAIQNHYSIPYLVRRNS